jgi:hypothetical protein
MKSYFVEDNRVIFRNGQNVKKSLIMHRIVCPRGVRSLRKYSIRIMVNFSIIRTVDRITDTFYSSTYKFNKNINIKKKIEKKGEKSLITPLYVNYTSSLRSLRS